MVHINYISRWRIILVELLIRDIIRIYVFPLDDNFVFGDIFFFGWYFFLPKATKKNTHPNKKNTHQQTKLLIQRKHVYTYDISFLCPPTILKSMCYFNSWQCSVVYLQDCWFFLEYTANELFQILALSIQGSIWFSYTFLPSYSWVGLLLFFS